jgi:hypothetical protein
MPNETGIRTTTLCIVCHFLGDVCALIRAQLGLDRHPASRADNDTRKKQLLQSKCQHVPGDPSCEIHLQAKREQESFGGGNNGTFNSAKRDRNPGTLCRDHHRLFETAGMVSETAALNLRKQSPS